MKRTFISIGVLLTMLALSAAVFGQPAERAGQRRERPAPGQAPVGDRRAAAQAQLAQRLQKQIDELKAGHQSLIDELRAIHQAAVKEKATETAGKVEALITKRQEMFQGELRQLEQQQQRLLRATRERPGRAQQGATRGRKAPDFELKSFDGRTVKLSDYGDEIIVLEWFNFECPFSRYHHETTQTMAELAKKYREKGVRWFAVNSTSHTTTEANREFAGKHKLPYPILDDRTGQVGRLYGARTTPHMFVIDKDGTIVYDGAIDNAPLGKPQAESGKTNYVDKALSELLTGRKVSIPNTPPYGCTVKYAAQ